MAKGYWIGQADVSDERGRAIYVQDLTEFLKSKEFPDYETASAAYHSEEYQEIRKLRQNTAIVDLVIVEGFDPTL